MSTHKPVLELASVVIPPQIPICRFMPNQTAKLILVIGTTFKNPMLSPT